MTPTAAPRLRRRSRLALGFMATACLGLESVAPAAGQATGSTTTSTLSPNVAAQPILTISHENFGLVTSGTAFVLGNQNRTTVSVHNPGTLTLYNQQIVVRVGVRPDSILSVREVSGNTGVMDILSGGWYHIIPMIVGGSTASFIVNWNKVCPGRFPVAARVEEVFARETFTWTGSASGGAACPADETVAPQPASYYALPWPPSIANPTTLVTTTTVVPSPTTTAARPLGATTLVPTSTSAPSPPTTAEGTTTTRPKPAALVTCRTVKRKRQCATIAAVLKTGLAEPDASVRVARSSTTSRKPS